MSESIAAVTLARIAGAARAQGLSRRALALRAGVRPETVSRIASRGTCDFATLERLAAAAGLRLGLQDEVAHAAGQARGEVLRKQALVRTLAFLVELEPGRSMLDLIGLAEDLQEALGRKVEAVTASGLKPRVLKEARRDAVRIV